MPGPTGALINTKDIIPPLILTKKFSELYTAILGFFYRCEPRGIKYYLNRDRVEI